MEYKVLGFQDAMRLAIIIDKHSVGISQNITVGEYLEGLLASISPMEYLEVLKLLTGAKEFIGISGEELARALIDGLVKNKVLYLLETYKRFEGTH